jgi:hypothetical protein
MSDGPVRVAFVPHLNSGQYTELLTTAQVLSKRGTSDDLRKELEGMTARWGAVAKSALASPAPAASY